MTMLFDMMRAVFSFARLGVEAQSVIWMRMMGMGGVWNARFDERWRILRDDGARLAPVDLSEWMSANGDVPRGAYVAMRSGWASKVGTDARRICDRTVQHYPGSHVEVVQMQRNPASAGGAARIFVLV